MQTNSTYFSGFRFSLTGQSALKGKAFCPQGKAQTYAWNKALFPEVVENYVF